MDALISKTLVPEHKRLDFLPTHTSKHFMEFETMIYEYMGNYCTNYSGGFWDFYTLSNGGFYMAVDSEEALNLECEGNYFADSMSADAASIGITLFVLCDLASIYDSDRFTTAFHNLRDYALDHPEAGKIFAFID